MKPTAMTTNAARAAQNQRATICLIRLLGASTQMLKPKCFTSLRRSSVELMIAAIHLTIDEVTAETLDRKIDGFQAA